MKSSSKARVLLIYTGGTIGMMQDPVSGELKPFAFTQLYQQIPELQHLPVELEALTTQQAIDSSNMDPRHWIELVELLETHYEHYEGFVVLHGSDTMSYTASALSFMLVNLSKPVVLTGSQLPIGVIRTDGKENVLTAIEIAAARKPDGTARVPEVCVYFEYKLYRGNRCFKYNSEQFEAFKSPHYPYLAEAGVHITYNDAFIRCSSNPPQKLQTLKTLSSAIHIMSLFPGMREEYVYPIRHTTLKALILLTYGAGNGPTENWFVSYLKQQIKEGLLVFNVTQCKAGTVVLGMYQTSMQFKNLGVVGAGDMTLEAALTKLMVLLGQSNDTQWIKHQFETNLRGERSPLQ